VPAGFGSAKFIAKEPWPRCKPSDRRYWSKNSLKKQKQKGVVMALIYDFEVDIAGAKLNNRIKDELRSLFRDNLGKPRSKSRISHQALGVKTQRMRSLYMIAAIEILQNVGNYRFESLSALKEKHIHYLIEHWISKNHARGTLENKITYLATLAGWLGKSNIVKSAEEYEQLKSLESRTGTTVTDKSWESRNIDAQQMIAQIAADNPHVAIQLALQITFGLRTEESMLLRPFDVSCAGRPTLPHDCRWHQRRSSAPHRCA
jgi:hypothetical protein